jgi:hypothetical protein
LSSASRDLTAILATASEKSREALDEGADEAHAWLEAVQSGARSSDTECVTCGRGGELQDNHAAGRRHGDLKVPQCIPCHQEFTEGQDLWDPRWQSETPNPELDKSLLLRGLYDLLLLRAHNVPKAKAGAYVALAESVRERYAFVARRTK